MAQARPVSRQNNQQGRAPQRRGTGVSRGKKKSGRGDRLAWELDAGFDGDGGNHVVPFHIETGDEDDDERFEAKARSPGDDDSDNDSECGDDPKNVSVACSEWLEAASKGSEEGKDDDDDRSSGGAPEGDSKRPPAAINTKLENLQLGSATACNQSADIEFSPLRTMPSAALIEGSIVRCNSGTNRLAPQYQFFLKSKLVLLAQKQLNNRTSNYHVFDMSRGGCASQKLTKKSGNYVGKLRSNFAKHENVMISAQAERSELGAILFESKVSTSKPRRLTVVCPPLSSENDIVPHVARTDVFSTLLEQHKTEKRPATAAADRLLVLENKEPEYEKGCYRLNFNGRVSIPSVKNFQLIARGGPKAGVVLQFGKVSDKLFHLDFKHPLTPFQAFAIALSQFNY
ncbi:Aste57867_16013 [Aphanomyces stellatus]|uniref:Aste57867_16013 protein n=1 Tax=Aphanomyces stellatus TaxID=120398 RepID=A0A485L4G6_9STRA|nr:hypothetical protein As57867_015957 [Aphanomyces stellatus]VFT92798.1 Aste57867_16013 [Aphanomyces stellatus]